MRSARLDIERAAGPDVRAVIRVYPSRAGFLRAVRRKSIWDGPRDLDIPKPAAVRALTVMCAETPRADVLFSEDDMDEGIIAHEMTHLADYVLYLADGRPRDGRPVMRIRFDDAAFETRAELLEALVRFTVRWRRSGFDNSFSPAYSWDP